MLSLCKSLIKYAFTILLSKIACLKTRQAWVRKGRSKRSLKRTTLVLRQQLGAVTEEFMIFLKFRHFCLYCWGGRKWNCEREVGIRNYNVSRKCLLPQMPQKWVNTTPFGSGHTLGTLTHSLEPLVCYFITLFGARGSLDPPGAPWRPPGPPGAPLTPGMSSWAIVSHPGSSWVIFDPSGVNNWGIYTTVHCTALWCTVVHFGGVG